MGLSYCCDKEKLFTHFELLKFLISHLARSFVVCTAPIGVCKYLLYGLPIADQ